MTIAAVLGLDTAAGAYLARLLGARGIGVRGTGGTALLDQLGIAGDVAREDSATIATLGADLVFDLRGDASATIELLGIVRRQRLFVAVDPSDGALIDELATARASGRFVATGRVYPNESRLGPGTSPVARIVVAAASGQLPYPGDVESNTDCGWTPEYVDSMRQLLQLPTPVDEIIATGKAIRGGDVARIALAFFRGEAVKRPSVAPAMVTTTGWRAITWGQELVEVLCEGFAAERGKAR